MKVLEKTLESPLDSKEIKTVNLERNQPRIFIGRTAAKAEDLILWPLDAKSQLTGNTLMVEKMRAGGEGVNRGWDGWMASPIEWT